MDGHSKSKWGKAARGFFCCASPPPGRRPRGASNRSGSDVASRFRRSIVDRRHDPLPLLHTTKISINPCIHARTPLALLPYLLSGRGGAGGKPCKQQGCPSLDPSFARTTQSTKQTRASAHGALDDVAGRPPGPRGRRRAAAGRAGRLHLCQRAAGPAGPHFRPHGRLQQGARRVTWVHGCGMWSTDAAIHLHHWLH